MVLPRLTGAVSVLAVLLGPLAGSAQEAVFRVKPGSPDAIRVYVVTGGHDHEVSFYSLFEDRADLDVVVDPHPGAFRGSPWSGLKKTDVVVLYDMVPDLEPARQQNLQAFAESGKGIVALHHAICAHTKWAWWYESVIGGRYLFEPAGGLPPSSYQHDVEMAVSPRGTHPITAGIRPFRIFDETYKGLWISPQVQVLLETDHRTSDGPVAWIGPPSRSRVVYIQLGHGRDAHRHPVYREIVHRAIRWAAGRLSP